MSGAGNGAEAGEYDWTRVYREAVDEADEEAAKAAKVREAGHGSCGGR